jgi:hypothetical protein
MRFIVPFLMFGISMGTLMVWGFRAKKREAKDGAARSEKAA